MATAVVTETRAEGAYRRFLEALAFGTEGSLLLRHVILAGRYASEHGYPNTAKFAFDEIEARYERGDV